MLAPGSALAFDRTETRDHLKGLLIQQYLWSLRISRNQDSETKCYGTTQETWQTEYHKTTGGGRWRYLSKIWTTVSKTVIDNLAKTKVYKSNITQIAIILQETAKGCIRGIESICNGMPRKKVWHLTVNETPSTKHYPHIRTSVIWTAKIRSNMDTLRRHYWRLPADSKKTSILRPQSRLVRFLKLHPFQALPFSSSLSSACV